LPARSALRYSAFFFVTACRCVIVCSIETGVTHIRRRFSNHAATRRFSNEATYLATRRFSMSQRGCLTREPNAGYVLYHIHLRALVTRIS
jgi:hypothetical protein